MITAFRNRRGAVFDPAKARLATCEIGRIERTVHNLDWIEDKGLRADTADVLNKHEARHMLARAMAFHRLDLFSDRSHKRQSHRATALNLVTARDSLHRTLQLPLSPSRRCRASSSGHRRPL
jgi:TnpA family transposase